MFLTQVFNLVTNMNCINQPTIRMRRCSTPGNQKSGQIQLIFGPMFSGKSTELIRRLKRYQIANYSCLIVKYAKDVRYNSESIATHDKQTLKAVSTTKLFNLMDAIDDASYDVIGIDEGQFFPDVVEFCEKMANEGKTVIVAALDGTFQRKEFGSILNLVPLAENVIKLSAVCMLCFGEGSYTKRISEDKELEVIGGAEKYMAVCRRCYFSQGKIAASPRVPFKTLCQNEMDDSEVQIFPPKKALFDSNGCNRIQAESMT